MIPLLMGGSVSLLFLMGAMDPSFLAEIKVKILTFLVTGFYCSVVPQIFISPFGGRTKKKDF